MIASLIKFVKVERLSKSEEKGLKILGSSLKIG